MIAFFDWRSLLGAATAFIVAAPRCVVAMPLAAQQRADSIAPAKDSVSESHTGPRQTVVVGATTRRYRIGDSTVNERVGGVSYTLSSSRVRLRLEGSALRYSAFSDTISGSPPGRARLDIFPMPGDTLTVFVRTASRPGSLDTRQTEALGNAGTSTLDLDSFQFGMPSVGGAGAALAFPVGSLVLGVRGGLEYEPRPSGTNPIYWRGTTLTGGLSLTGANGESQATASANLSVSSADSLGGRNLFPGGGMLGLQVVADISVPNPADELDESLPLRAAMFYSRPFNDIRNNQPNRLVPRGSVAGGLVSLLVPVRSTVLTPSIQVVRESSSDQIARPLSRRGIEASGWTASFGLDASLPLGNHFELDPEAGYTTGSLGATYTQTVIGLGGRAVSTTSRFSDAIRGGWLTLELRASF